jgi:hypothetical protein
MLAVVRGLVEAAESERRLLAQESPERQFYLGVEASAQEVLHPELAESRSEDWLRLKTSAFRDGYLRTSVLIATAATVGEPPLRLPLPSPGPTARDRRPGRDRSQRRLGTDR